MSGLSDCAAVSERPITQKRTVTTERFFKTATTATVQFESLKLDFIEIGEIIKS